MIEFDENGDEWFGYSFGGDEKDPASTIAEFTGNVQYVEWLCERTASLKGGSLRSKFERLFDLLPEPCRRAITDDRPALLSEIVRLRNRYAHGKFDDPAPSSLRLQTLTLKIAALLFFYEQVADGRTDSAIESAGRGSPYLREVLARTDVLAQKP